MAHRSYSTAVFTALIGPNTLFREGLRRVLHGTQYQAQEIAETADRIQQTPGPDLVIFAMCNDDSSLLDQIRRVKDHRPDARVVVVNGTTRAETVWALLGAGADGYLSSGSSPEAALASLDVVMLGGTVVPSFPRNGQGPGPALSDMESVKAASLLKTDADPYCKKLSERETNILLCLMKGESNKQIARKFDIAEATVKVHLKAILRKIHVSNRTQAAVWAHNHSIGRAVGLPEGQHNESGPPASRDATIGVEKRIATRLRNLQEELLVTADAAVAPALSMPRRSARNSM
jgi:two-component system nitrate/nitrite response regulator NarL